MVADFATKEQPNLHFLIFGSLAFLSGLLNMRLPETSGQPTPETIQDMLTQARMSPKTKPPSDGQGGYSKLATHDPHEDEIGGGHGAGGKRNEGFEPEFRKIHDV